MVNIALCIPGAERAERPEAYLEVVEFVLNVCQSEMTEAMSAVNPDAKITIYHGMTFKEGDTFATGLAQVLKGFDVVRIVVPSGSDREGFAQELSDNFCQVFHIGPTTQGIAKEIGALMRMGYVELTSHSHKLKIGDDLPSIARYVPGRNIA